MNLPARAGKIPGISKFDAEFFGMDDKTADEMDPQVKINLEAIYGAVIDAGMCPDDLKNDRTGLFIGNCLSNSTFARQCCFLNYDKPDRTEGMFDHMKYLGIKGPMTVYDSACASAFSALDSAVKAIRAGLLDTAIVSGLMITSCPFDGAAFRSLGMTSHEGKCYSMDKRSNGYVR